MQRYSSPHANYLHQLGVSVSKHFWISKQGILSFQHKKMDVNLDNMSKSSKNHVVHFVIRDHFSGVLYSETVSSAGNISLELFLYRAWTEKEDFAFCGVPDILVIPNTVQRKFPLIKEKLSSLEVQLPDAKSGFQTSVRDIQSIESYMKRYIGTSFETNFQDLNKAYIQISNFLSRDQHKQPKIDIWSENIESLKFPPFTWIQ